MRKYETIFIVRPNVAEDGITALVDRATGIIEGFDGSVIKADHWGLRKLAYLIKKEQQGYYVLLEYAGTPQAVTEMERIFKIDDRVLKYMTVKLAHSYVPGSEPLPEEEPQAVAEAAETEAEA